MIGSEILRGVDFLGEAIAVVRHHHERWDGGGYPDGLRGDEIPLAARVFAVADALDALTTDRPYRPAVGWAEARAEIAPPLGHRSSTPASSPPTTRSPTRSSPRLRDGVA